MLSPNNNKKLRNVGGCEDQQNIECNGILSKNKKKSAGIYGRKIICEYMDKIFKAYVIAPNQTKLLH